jgi:hypothetical protein
MKVTRDARAIWLVLFLLFATVLTGWMLGSLSKAEVKDGVSNTIDKNFLAESLPCTGPSEPANFRAFGLGDSFTGETPLTSSSVMVTMRVVMESA